MQKIKEGLAGYHYILVDVQGELRVYDMTRSYYVSVKHVASQLPPLVSLVRLTNHSSDYELFTAVKQAVSTSDTFNERELDLCG